MSFEIASAISLVCIVGVIAFFFKTVYENTEHGFLKIIFFMLSFPAMSGLAYYAKVIAVDNYASTTAVDVLTTFYKFTIWLLMIAYAYLSIRAILWMLSKYKTGRVEPWEANNELI